MLIEPAALPVVLKKMATSALARTVLTSLGKVLHDFQEAKGERAVASLINALCRLRDCGPDEAAARLEDLLTSGADGAAYAHEALYEDFRSKAFARTEAAWPYIAMLTAEYVEQGRMVDTFFRRAAWLLERCDEEDVALFLKVMTICRELLVSNFDAERYRAVVWWTELDTLHVNPTDRQTNAPLRDVGGSVFCKNIRVVPDFFALVKDSRIAPVSMGSMLNYPIEDETLIRLVELFTGRLSDDTLYNLGIKRTQM